MGGVERDDCGSDRDLRRKLIWITDNIKEWEAQVKIQIQGKAEMANRL